MSTLAPPDTIRGALHSQERTAERTLVNHVPMLTLDENPPVMFLASEITGESLVCPVDSDVGPVSLLTNPDNSMTPDGLCWFVTETRARHEKTVARFLHENNRSYFLPMSVERTPSRNRVFKPIIPGFVFVAYNPSHADDDLSRAKSDCLDSRSCFNFIFTKNQAQLRIDLIMLATRGASAIESTPSDWIGLPVEVIDGPSKGVTGTIVSQSGEITRIAISMQLLGHTVTIPVPTVFLSSPRTSQS